MTSLFIVKERRLYSGDAVLGVFQNRNRAEKYKDELIAVGESGLIFIEEVAVSARNKQPNKDDA